MALYYFSNTPHAMRADGSKVNTKAHYNYICRQGKYTQADGREEDLAYTASGNMPQWADDPGVFWQAAEQYRQRGGRAYREIRMGLQEELSLEDNIALVEAFLEQSGIGKNHAYTYAVHDKPAAFDTDHRNIHVHIMFNEKMIEKDRPLTKDMYFRHYYLNKDGKPCAGYKASRYYKSSTGMKEMRKVWADLVNEKLRERGIDASVSEKSLSAQAKELREAGKEEEAALLDRVPAPHLGNAYKTPQVKEKIHSLIEQIRYQTEHPEETTEEAAQTDVQGTVEEQKMVLFATDALLRQITREIYREQEKIRQQEIMEREAASICYLDETEAEKMAQEPIVITVNDVVEQLEKRRIAAAQELQARKQENERLRKEVIPENRIRAEAVFHVMGSEYRNAKKRLERIQDQLVPMRKEYTRLKEVPYKEKKAFMDEFVAVLDKKKTTEILVRSYEEQIREIYQDAIVKEETRIREANEQYRKEAGIAYGASKRAEREMQRLSEKLETVRQAGVPGDKILREKNMPSLVFGSCKVDGRDRLKDMPILAVDGKAYVFLPRNAADEKNGTRRCVLLGDTIYHGKASVYVLKGTLGENGKIDIAVKKSDEKVRLYPPYASSKNPLSRMPKTRSVQLGRQTIRSRALTMLVDKAVADSARNTGTYHAWWDDEEKRLEPKDEVQRLDAEISRGMGM